MIVACYLAVASCIYSFWHSVIPTSYFTFNDLYTCFTHFCGVAYCGNFRISQSRLLKGTNCLFASKDHVRPVSKRLWIIFMACSCPNFVLGRLKKKEGLGAIPIHRESTDC